MLHPNEILFVTNICKILSIIPEELLVNPWVT